MWDFEDNSLGPLGTVRICSWEIFEYRVSFVPQKRPGRKEGVRMKCVLKGLHIPFQTLQEEYGTSKEQSGGRADEI